MIYMIIHIHRRKVHSKNIDITVLNPCDKEKYFINIFSSFDVI